MQVAFKQIDVFTAVPYKGNPVAVILHGDGITAEQMQAIANWTNLSETTFVLPPTVGTADYRVRIFTPHAELPFAGHPTIGTAHALLEAEMVNPHHGRLVQQCDAGLINLAVDTQREDGRWIAFELPPARLTPLTDQQVADLERIMGATVDGAHRPAIVDVGPRWLIAQLPTASAVLSVRPDFQQLRMHDERLQITGVTLFGPHQPGAGTAIELRSFAPTHGIDEDPVCGSGTGSVGAFILHGGQLENFGAGIMACQGSVLGRAGTLRLTFKDDRISVAGQAVTCIDGHLTT